MKKLLILFILFFVGQNAFCQETDKLNQEVAPKGGITQLALEYYGIDFSKEQRNILKGKKVELTYHIDKLGKPTLTDINGVVDIAIMDSLKAKSLELENFNPSIKDGEALSSIYFMQIEFPSYQTINRQYGMTLDYSYNEASLDDFEYINKSGQRMDIIVGGLINQFLGKPAKHLKLGGGMKTSITYSDKKQFIYGLNMSFYGNKLKKEYPINTVREFASAPPTLLVGASFGKWINQLNIQAEVNIATQNITISEGENDPEWVQFNGWSPGIIVNFPILIGKEKAMYYYGSPSIFSNNLNVHFGLRYLKFSLKEASGFMLELGVSYNMSLGTVNKYKLKEEFLNR